MESLKKWHLYLQFFDDNSKFQHTKHLLKY